MGIAFAPGGEIAYLMHASGGTVTKVNAVTHQVVATIQVSTESYLGDIVVSPDGRFFYTANGLGQFSVVDTGTNAVVAHVPVGGRELAITPDGKFVYAIPLVRGFAVIDTSTNAAAVIDVRLGDPRAIVIRPRPPTDQ